ncbi:hypothetical protein LUZ60_007507 [Juncus effusus]|nr:hypothetical protein LUZ60_007507 [Juncus effusus]
MAETDHDSFSNEPTNQTLSTNTKKKKKKKTESKLHSWRSSLDIFSTCKNYQQSETKKNKTKTKAKKEKKKKNTITNRASSNSCEDDMNRAVSASSSFSSVTTSASTLSSLSSLSSSFSSIGGSFRAMQIRKLSGCSEINCNAIVGPVSWVSSPSLRASLSPCDDCGEIFTKPESLELHQTTQHAVSELGSEDSSRNIVEIIFQSSWRKKQSPICKIERILKIQNTKITISKFENYRDTIKLKSLNQKRSNPRCTADGNELLRFYGSTFSCKLGFDGMTNLCKSTHKCEICGIIKDGFRVDLEGKISTFATSSGAHDVACDDVARGLRVSEGEKKAMLVCRVISGKVQRTFDGESLDDECDSVSSSEGNLDELVVFNPTAILPCFVVVYSGY